MPKKKTATISLMEVCGTHTMAIARAGLRSRFPGDVRMLSGPGCPVCVTPAGDIDRAIAIARLPGVTVTTFGDMLRVPGSRSSLAQERAGGADVRVVYSPADALELAAAAPRREIVFLGVGFETTSPAVAAAVVAAEKKRLHNFSVLPMFKTVPAALRFLLENNEAGIDGFMLPGHVSALIGEAPYRFIASEFSLPGVIAGFEPADILRVVDRLRDMIIENRPAVINDYRRLVRPEGNPAAMKTLDRVFGPCGSEWRAIGQIPASGLSFRPGYAAFDAAARFPVKLKPAAEPKACRCGAILTGKLLPRECRLFGRTCTPAHPVGPCMVSSEGSCAAEYKYGTRTGHRSRVHEFSIPQKSR